MSNTIRIRRRAAGGAAGAPTSLANAELAFNEQDSVLYYGFGSGGAGGNATSVIAIAGPGAFAPLDSAALVGNPTAPTQAPDNSTTRLATTAFVLGQLSSASPVMNGTAAVGTSLRFARADHVHPTDTSRAALASPTFTGTPAAPTAAADTNTTQLATTAYVLGQLSGVTPAALGSASVGTATRFARADHVHAMPTLSQVGAPTAAVSMNSQRITNLAEPTGPADATTKSYVDNISQGLNSKASVRVATTANITLSGTQTIDGVALTVGMRVLVKNQTNASQNGIYVVASGAWTRAVDADVWDELVSAYCFVEQGTVHADQGWLSIADRGGTLGTTTITWTQFNGAGGAGFTTAGNGLTASGNTVSVNPGTGISVAGGPTALAGQALALHNVATAADQLIYATGAATFTTTTLTAFGRSLVDDADAPTARTTLGLGSLATQGANAVAITGGTIGGVTLDGGVF
jgi:hypothetical protein